MAAVSDITASTSQRSMEDDRLAQTPRSKTLPPRINLPLPRELRDQIYGYLLYHAHVMGVPYSGREPVARSEYSRQTQRHKNAVHTFHFHTGILAVNHTLNSEAMQTLAQNQFVVVSFEWVGLEIAKHYHAVPVVCEDQKAVAKFKQHHMRVHIQHPTKVGRTNGVQRFLMLAQDLPVFCGEMMQWTFLMVPSPSTILANLPGNPPNNIQWLKRHQDDTVLSVRTKIQLRSTDVKAMTPALEAALLEPFVGMIIGLQKVTIMGASQSKQASILQVHMGPEIVSLLPKAWRAFEVAQRIKVSGDHLLCDGYLGLALDRYALLVNMNQACKLLDLPHAMMESDALLLIACLQRTVTDATVTAGFLHLRMCDKLEAAQLLGELQVMVRFMVSLPNQAEVFPASGSKLLCLQGNSWLLELVRFVWQRDFDTLQPLLGSLREILNVMDDATSRAAVAHDIDFIDAIGRKREGSSYIDSPKHRISDEDLIKSLSVCQLGPLIFSTPTPQDLKKPGDFDGFLEKSHKQGLAAQGFM